MNNARFYFKMAKVKGIDYLQIWDRTNNRCYHVGSATKILKLVNAKIEPLEKETKLTETKENGLTFDREEKEF